MRTIAVVVVLSASLISVPARAQQAPSNVWTKFQTPVAHATVAGIACALNANAVIEGRTRLISLQAVEDGRQLCIGSDAPDAIHGRVQMTADVARSPTEIVVDLDAPPNASPNAMNDLRNVLVNMSADLDRRSNANVPPVMHVAPPPPPPVQTPQEPLPPMHRVTYTNVPLIAAGGAVFGAGYLVSALVGVAIVGASGDPGTGRYWPFVPFIGAIAFSTTYKEAANCDCATGRVLSVIGSVLIDLVQVAGVVITIVGVTVPRTKMVPDKISVRLGPTGAVLEGRF